MGSRAGFARRLTRRGPLVSVLPSRQLQQEVGESGDGARLQQRWDLALLPCMHFILVAEQVRACLVLGWETPVESQAPRVQGIVAKRYAGETQMGGRDSVRSRWEASTVSAPGPGSWDVREELGAGSGARARERSSGTFGPGYPVLVRPISGGVYGALVGILLHCLLDHPLQVSLVHRIFHSGHR